MQTNLKLALATLIALFVLTAAVSTASANRFRISEQEMEIAWNPLSFTNGSSLNVRCHIILLGRFHRATLNKTLGALTGYINHAKIQQPCIGGSVYIYNGEEVNSVLGGTLPSSLPWHITYEGFEGVLPNNITNVRLLFLDSRFLVRATILGIALLCIYKTRLEQPGEGRANLTSGIISSLPVNESLEIEAKEESSPICPTAHYSGTGAVTNLAGTNSVTVSLV